MKVGFLEESEGVRSAVRLIFVFGSFWNMGLCTVLAITGTDPVTLLATFTAIEASLLGMKLGQKQLEKQK